MSDLLCVRRVEVDAKALNHTLEMSANSAREDAPLLAVVCGYAGSNGACERVAAVSIIVGLVGADTARGPGQLYGSIKLIPNLILTIISTPQTRASGLGMIASRSSLSSPERLRAIRIPGRKKAPAIVKSEMVGKVGELMCSPPIGGTAA